MIGKSRSLPRRSLRRSLRLFCGFLAERSDPETFYTALAEDTCEILSAFVDFSRSSVLDIGGGPGYFAEAASKRGARTITVDCSVQELSLHGRQPNLAVLGDGIALPIKDDSFDLVHTSNVLEHVPSVSDFLDETIRVTKSSGIIFVSFTVWLSLWGGHETSPWHLLGGERAARRYHRKHGKPPKNRFQESLFPVYISDFERLVKNRPNVSILESFPRYYPHWASFLARLPLMREFATWNYAAILSKA
ncbi:MAG: SAM-dependent methyltransferase [Acidimicrobiia bacterium]